MVNSIRLLDHVTRCSTYEDGAIIYRLIKSSLEKGEIVSVSFDGVLSAPSAFINGALVELLNDYTFSHIRENVLILNTTRSLNELIKQRFEFASKHGSKPK